jgi:hypothetical protein
MLKKILKSKRIYFILFFLVLSGVALKFFFYEKTVKDFEELFRENRSDYEALITACRDIPTLRDAGEVISIEQTTDEFRKEIKSYWREEKMFRSEIWSNSTGHGERYYTLAQLCEIEKLPFEKVFSLQEKIKKAGVLQTRKINNSIRFFVYRHGLLLWGDIFYICYSKELPEMFRNDSGDEFTKIAGTTDWWIQESGYRSRKRYEKKYEAEHKDKKRDHI